MTCYYLSNRQLKELANGKQLVIALPDPGENVVLDRQLARWAARMMHLDESLVRTAARESVEVFRKRSDHQVCEEIGTIRMEQTPSAEIDGRLTWWIEVIVVTICERNRPRSTYPVQWPARYEFTED
jgi:hypothetical protein